MENLSPFLKVRPTPHEKGRNNGRDETHAKAGPICERLDLHGRAPRIQAVAVGMLSPHWGLRPDVPPHHLRRDGRGRH